MESKRESVKNVVNCFKKGPKWPRLKELYKTDITPKLVKKFICETIDARYNENLM